MALTGIQQGVPAYPNTVNLALPPVPAPQNPFWTGLPSSPWASAPPPPQRTVGVSPFGMPAAQQHLQPMNYIGPQAPPPVTGMGTGGWAGPPPISSSSSGSSGMSPWLAGGLGALAGMMLSGGNNGLGNLLFGREGVAGLLGLGNNSGGLVGSAVNGLRNIFGVQPAGAGGNGGVVTDPGGGGEGSASGFGGGGGGAGGASNSGSGASGSGWGGSGGDSDPPIDIPIWNDIAWNFDANGNLVPAGNFVQIDPYGGGFDWLDSLGSEPWNEFLWDIPAVDYSGWGDYL